MEEHLPPVMVPDEQKASYENLKPIFGYGSALLRLPRVPGNRSELASEEVRQYGLESESPLTTNTQTTHEI